MLLIKLVKLPIYYIPSGGDYKFAVGQGRRWNFFAQ